jgi:hypothetical protein
MGDDRMVAVYGNLLMRLFVLAAARLGLAGLM